MMLVEVEPTLWVDPHQIVALRASTDGTKTSIHMVGENTATYRVDRPLAEVVAALSEVTAGTS